MMRRNYRVTVRRLCAAVALVMATAWGIPALAPAPAALASPAVASAATHSTPPPSRRRDAGDCTTKVEKAGYTVTAKVISGCQLGATTVPGVAPHVSIGLQLSACGGLLTWAGIDPITMTFACFLAVGLGLLSTQYCGPNFGNDCLNAWGGGPYVNVYTGGDETRDTNQNFMVIAENGNQNTAEIMYTGSSGWNGRCIGDAKNDSGLADVSLDACARPGQSAGWGTQFTWGTSGCPSGTVWFHNNHWPGYLGPAGNAVNGSHWYLNKPSKVCLTIWTNLAV
jgi:hypothetical protein